MKDNGKITWSFNQDFHVVVGHKIAKKLLPKLVDEAVLFVVNSDFDEVDLYFKRETDFEFAKKEVGFLSEKPNWEKIKAELNSSVVWKKNS